MPSCSLICHPATPWQVSTLMPSTGLSTRQKYGQRQRQTTTPQLAGAPATHCCSSCRGPHPVPAAPARSALCRPPGPKAAYRAASGLETCWQGVLWSRPPRAGQIWAGSWLWPRQRAWTLCRVETISSASLQSVITTRFDQGCYQSIDTVCFCK